MLVDTYAQEGKKVGQARLPSEIFDVKINPDLIHQIVVSQRANKRQIIAHTKNRGEVSGGGKKPWAQKHMGKARHGSIRSPIWRHGGVVFGPRKEKVFKKNISRKMKRKALFMVLTDRVKNNLLILLDKLNIEQPKTKLVAEILENLKKEIKDFKGGSFLIALPKMDKSLILAARNIPKVKVIQAKDLNCLDLISFKYLIMPKDSIKVIKETFIGK